MTEKLTMTINNSLLMIESATDSTTKQRELEQQGWLVTLCSTAQGAFQVCSNQVPNVILVSSDVPDMQLTDCVSALTQQYPDTVILVVVTSLQCRLAADAIACGAADYLLRPYSSQRLNNAIDQALILRQPLANMIVSSVEGRQVIQLAHRAAQTDASILISGESGTGKELLAQYIHQSSPRAAGPFVAINCAAIPENMIEAVLFGHVKGAYTGAVSSQPGKFELADGGTLMLDEISEMPLHLQVKLLRVLQQREVERLGSHKTIQLDIRIIAATNKNLAQLVDQGLFRQDLFYRLDVLPLTWPALRERSDDILPLTRHFLEKYSTDSDTEYSLSAGAKKALQQYHWPGNVRELENVIQRALIMARGCELQEVDLMLPQSVFDPILAPIIDIVPSEDGFKISKKQAEYQYVLDTLEKFNGHRTKTAAALGFTPRALRYKMAAMREQGIQV